MIPAHWSLAARVAAPLLVLAGLAAAVWGYGQRQHLAGVETGRKEIRKKWDDAKERQRKVDRAEQLRREKAHKEAIDAVRQETARAVAAAADAERAGVGLRQRYAAALQRRCDPPAAAGGPPATSAADLLADVQRRIDEAAGELAAVATARGTAGAACERIYDALSP